MAFYLHLRIPGPQVIEELSGKIRQFPGGVVKGGGDDDFPGGNALQEDLKRRTVFGVSVKVSDAIDGARSVINDHDVYSSASGIKA